MNTIQNTKKNLGSSAMIFIFPNTEGFSTTKLSKFVSKCIMNSGNLIESLFIGMKINNQ